MGHKIMNNRHPNISAFVRFLMVLIFAAFSTSTYAQGPVEGKIDNQISLSGWFSIIWGDSEDGQSSMAYILSDEKGRQTWLKLDENVAEKLGGVLKFNRQYVTVKGTLAARESEKETSIMGLSSRTSLGPPAALDVISISPVSLPESKAPAFHGTAELAVSGSHPWVTIMCKFSDITDEPNDRNYFLGMYDDTEPGLNHYWKQLSFNEADITGSTVGPDWFVLPQTELHYNPTDTEKGTDLDALAEGCVAAADDDVDFSPYSGINMMFNSDFDNGWAWGGSKTFTLDGVTKSWSITWEPPWSYRDISVISHEMGHGFGLPHSSYDRSVTYDNPWDVMSQDRYNCAAATDSIYGCVAQHTISYHKDLLDWIPVARKTTVSSGAVTVTLEDLAAQAYDNYQMVKIPIGGFANNFYTVEARRYTGYDGKLPDEGVVIHNVDTTNGIPAVLVPDGSRTDPWNVGETFTDTANNIAVTVNAATATGYEVTISNGNLPPTSDAGGPYEEECMGSTTPVALDGSGSSDPEGTALTYLWNTSCDGTFDDAAVPWPILTLNTSDVCNNNCSVSLTVTDEDGLSSGSDEAIVTIKDTTKPELVGVPIDGTVECNDVPPPANVTATDRCATNVTPIFEESRADGSCADNYTLTRQWFVEDNCGNRDSAVQVIDVKDTTSPVIIGPEDITIECDEATDPENTGWAVISDNCDDELSVIYSDDVDVFDEDCPSEKSIRRTWTATDACGNSSSRVQIISIVDTTAPVISCNNLSFISPNEAPISFTATSIDNCDPAPSAGIIDYDCFSYTKKGKRIDKTESCGISVEGSEITIVDSGGVGDHIVWTIQANDCTGNYSTSTCRVEVVNPTR